MVCPASFGAQADDFGPGDYLEDGFLAKLRETRSPWASLRNGPVGGYPQGIVIRPGADGVDFDGNFNWHEGCRLFSVATGGVIKPGESGYCGFDPHVLLKADRPDHVEIAFGTRRLGYSRVGAAGSMDLFVAVMAIGGRYRDARGGPVVFDAGGRVTGLTPEGPFSVTLDHIMEPFDTVILGDGAVRYAFRWQGRKLVFYPMRRGPQPAEEAWPFARPDYAHPLHLLTEINRIVPASSANP